MTSLAKHFRFLAKTPKVAVRIMDGVFRAQIFGQNRVRNCQMALTQRCNHKCNMCSSNLLLQDKEELTLEQWCSVVDQLKELGCTHFDLTGGEPTLRGLDFLKKLISHINWDKDRIVSLATNGTLVDRNWLRELNEAGLNSILFNMQSVEPTVHDKITGDEGNLDRVKGLIPLAKKEGLNACINTCLGSYNIDEIKELLDWCEKNNLFTLINLAAPTGRLAGRDVRIGSFRKEYYKILKSHSLARSDTSYNFRGPNLCPGGIEKIYITAYGDVMQCTFCQISFGNALEEPLKNIYKRFSQHPLIRIKDICKHTFNTEFREKWIDPIVNAKNPPIQLEKHPNYHLFFKKKNKKHT